MYSHFLSPAHSKNIIRKKNTSAGPTPAHQKKFNRYSERSPQLTNLFWLSNQAPVMDEEQQINASNQVGGKDYIPVASA